MTGKKAYMVVEAVLCALTAGLLAGAAIRMYVQGAAVQASGDLFYYIFTREKVGAVLQNILPLITALIAFTAAGWILKIRDESADKPVILKRIDVKRCAAMAVPQKSGRSEHILRIVFLCLAAALIIWGVLNGGLEDVFTKGSVICTECIGLG